MVYSLLLIIIYFSKKRINNLENKIFSSLIIVNFIGIIIDIISTFLAIIDFNIVVVIIFCKLYLFYLVVWLSIMTMYILVISLKEMNQEKFHKLTVTVLILLSLCLLLIAVLPLYSNRDNGNIYTYGPCASITYIISGFYVIVWIMCMIKNFSNL